MADLKAEFCQLYFANLNYLLMHRANLYLQKIFLERWQEATNKKWSNSEEQGKAFVSEIGKDIWTTSSRRQKILLQSGNVYLWDLKLCSHVLRKFHNDKEEEKRKLKELVVIQNEIKRNFDELSIPEDLYKNSWETVKKILEDFGHTMIPYAIDIPNFAWSSKDLLVLKNSLKSPKQFFTTDTFPEDTDPFQTLKAKDLKELGNTFYKDNKYDEALKVYKQALDLKGVSKELQGILYANASAVCSSLIESPKVNLIEELSDGIIMDTLEYAKRVVHLCPLWYKAHCRLGYAYEKCKKWKKAVKHFDIAIQLNENVPDIIRIRNACSQKLPHVMSRQELYIRQLKIDVESTNQNIVDKFGKKAADKVYKSNIPEMVVASTLQKITEAKTTQEYDDILKTLKKEGAKGSALALFTLGMMYKNSVGVKRDFLQSITYFKKAADKNPQLSMGLPDESVFGAENQLGIIFEYGFGVCNDLEEAAMWYKRSSDHQGLHGPCNLGMMYMRGSGVAKNLVKAEQYLTLAAKRGNADAMINLAEFYVNIAEDPMKALQWHRRAIECGYILSMQNTLALKLKIERLKSKYNCIDKKLENWELKKGLAVDGMMMKERRQRYLKRQEPEIVDFASSMKVVHEKFSKTQLLNDYTSGPKFSDVIINKYAKKGSMTAEKLKKATGHFKKGFEYLKIHKVHEAIKELANALRITELVVNINTCNIAIEMVSVTEQINAMRPNTQFDKDRRICLAYSLGNDYQSSISLLEESTKMYADEKWFPYMLTNIYGFMQNHKKGIEVANKALRKFPDDADIWYAKAVHLRSSSKNHIEVIDAYKKFISLVPPDHRKIPISYYAIAVHYLNHNPEDLTTVTKYYKQGLDAEKIQLPFFLPVESYHKSLLKNLSSLKPFLRLQFVNDEPIPRKVKIEKKKNEEEEDLKKFLDPLRVGLIVSHRKKVAVMKRKLAKVGNSFQLKTTLTPKLQQVGPPQLAEVKSIALEEMDPTKNQIYEGFALSCVVIDEPILGFPSVHVLIEDENWNVERLHVYNIPQDKEVYTKLGFGCRLTILNPYYKKGEIDNATLIRVDDPESIVFEDPDVGRCRFCGKNRASLQCSKCHRAAYCNRECQTNDWKVMKHKLVCH